MQLRIESWRDDTKANDRQGEVLIDKALVSKVSYDQKWYVNINRDTK